MTARGKGSVSFNPSLLGQEFLEGEREALPGYKIKPENVLITIVTLRAAADEKILPEERTFCWIRSP